MGLLHSKVINQIRANCTCQYSEENIKDENLIALCTNESIQVTYRARLLTVADYTAQELVDSIEMLRRLSSQVVWMASHNSSLVLNKAESCPTRIEYLTEPLCGTLTKTQRVCDCTCPVSQSTLVVYLLGEFVLLACLFVAGVFVALCLTKARRKR